MKGLKAKIRERRSTRWLLLVSNWLSQGIWNMDWTEKLYRIFTTSFLFIILFIIVLNFTELTLMVGAIFSFVIAHTINWLINSNLITLFIHRLLIGTTNKLEFFRYLEGLRKRIENENAIQGGYCFGSMSRGVMNSQSDLDLAFVRVSGFRNAIRAIIFFTKEKKIAQSFKIPTESFLCDSITGLKKRYHSSEPPVIVSEKLMLSKKKYSIFYNLKEAEKMNEFKSELMS